MIIEIDDDQRGVLRELIDWRLSSLSSEIRHTDSPQLRQGLRNEREILRSLVVLLAPEQAQASGQ